MKKIIALLFFIVTSSFYAQNSGITYQAVIYNPSTEILPGNNNPNVVLANKEICLRFSIKDAASSLEYQEVQKVKTDEFGMVNLVVGQGNQISGYATNFSEIVWNSSNKTLAVAIDANANCSNFIEVSEQFFSAVPFAYASKVAESVSGIVPIVNGGTGAATVAGARTNLGLNNVDNTSDLNKPVSTATQTALDLKAPLASPGFTGIPTAPTAVAGTSTTQIATTAFVNAALATAAAPDATTTLKGRIQLAGDLSGTAEAPTVPGLANKENLANKSTDMLADANSTIKYPSVKLIKEYVDTQVSAGAVDAETTRKGIIQLSGDLEGTADAPAITNAAVIGKVLTGFTSTAGTVLASDNIVQAMQKVDGNVALKENTIVAGDTSEYYRGDKTWQPLDKTAVGLNNVDNTSDINKPVSTATQTALSAKENTANKSDVTTLGLSDVLFPTQKAVKTYVDAQITANATPDATDSSKGKIQLGGDLAGTGSSAASPVITNNAISTNKIEDAAVTPAKIAVGSNNSVLVTNATGTVAWLDQGAFGAKADDSTIEGEGTASDPFKLKDDGITTIKIKNNAITTAKLADDAVTNAKIGETIAVENGGTGATSLTGYLKGNGTSAFTAVPTIPVAHVDGAVRKVNGVQPGADGNVAVIIGRVFSGAELNPDAAPSITGATPGKQQSDIYIVASTNNINNGRTFIYDGTNWLEVATDLSATDARYVNEAGDEMEGNLTFPTGTKIIIADAPTGNTDAVNKSYVDGLITSSATPDATDLIKGKIKLTNHLGGTADAPTVPGLAFKAPLESPSLTGTPLAPTAAAGTNTQQIATTAFVTAATSGMQDAITLTTTGTGAATLTGATLNIPTPNNGTVTNVAALTLGTSGTDITSTVATATTTPVITLNVPTASAANRGALNAADWTTFNDKVGGSGTTNYVPKFSAAKTLTDSSIFDSGTNVGIGTASPANTLEIKQGTAGNSGLRFTNLTASSAATTASSKVLGLNSNGDVILTNVPGTQNIVAFSTANPTTSGVVFTPNTPADESVVYQSAVDNSMWTYNGSAYVTYNAPASTAWFTSGTTNDAGNSKTSNIYRTGRVGIGTNNPQNNLDVVGGFNLRNTAGAAMSNYGMEFNTNGNSPRIDWVYNGNYTGSFAGDADFFFRLQNSRVGAGGFRFMTNPSGTAVERMTILNNGNVGIGNINPTATLDVQSPLVGTFVTTARFLTPSNTTAGNSNVLNFGVSATTGNSADWRYVYQSNGAATNRVDFGMSSYAAPMMSYLNSGNVGIGTTTPSSKLHIQGIQATLGANANAPMLRMSRPTWSGQKWGSAAQFNLGTYVDAGNNVDSKSRLDLALANGNDDTTLTTTMTWLANGNVGIRNTAPTATLDVNSSTVATNTVNADVTVLKLARPLNSGVKVPNIAHFNLGSFTTGGQPNSRLDLNLSNTTETDIPNVMTWQANGNVGINTTSPSAPLVVQANTVGTGVLKLAVPSVGTDNWWMGFSHGINNSPDSNDRARIGVDIALGGAGRLFFTTGGPGAQTRAMFIDQNQRVGIGTSTPTSRLDVVSSTTEVARFTTSLSTTNYAGIGIGNASGAWGKIASGEGKFQIRNFSTDATIINAELGTGNVGIGTTSPTSRLEVNGSATNTAAFNNGAANAIAFSLSNLAYTSLSAQLFNLTGMKDGGTYTLAVQGTTSGTSSFMGVNPSGTQFVFKSINNGTTIAGKDTLYTFVVMGTTVYVYMATGF
jgi:hypothetical protein